MPGFFRELSQRNVVRVAAGYVIVAWLIAQVVSVVDGPLNLPEWFDTVVVMLLALGFPIALLFAWAFELTPEGIRPSQPAAAGASPLPASRVIIDALILVGLTSMLVLTVYERDGAPTASSAAIGSPDEAGGAANAGVEAEPLSIAVLPFVDLSPDQDQEYFSDGIAEELIAELSRLPGLAIVGRTSAFSFKDSDETLQAIAEQLGVNHLVEGSLRRSGGTLRIRVQLTDGSGFSLWTETYDRPTDDIFEIQEDIARSVATQLSATLGVGYRPSTGTRNMAAYDAYLHGRHELAARTPTSIQRGFEYLQEAVALDSGYPLAHAGLADAYILLGSYGLMPLSESHPLARESALRAIDLDPELAEAWTSLASLNADYFWNWDEAGEQFERAIELNPNYPVAQQWYAEFLQRMGRTVEAVAAAERARDLDPLSPLMNSALAIAYYRDRRHEDAVRQANYTLELDPSFTVARIGLLLAYSASGNHDEALSAFPLGDVPITEYDDSSWVSLVGNAYGRAGYEREARAALDRLDDLPNALPIEYAYVHAGLGNSDEVFRWLERAYENRDWLMGMLKVDPVWDSLREDARFVSLLERMDLD